MSHEPSEYPLRGAMRAKECARFLGIGESTFWRWVASGLVPKGIRLTPRCTVWPVEELQTMVKRPQAAERSLTLPG